MKRLLTFLYLRKFANNIKLFYHTYFRQYISSEISTDLKGEPFNDGCKGNFSTKNFTYKQLVSNHEQIYSTKSGFSTFLLVLCLQLNIFITLSRSLSLIFLQNFVEEFSSLGIGLLFTLKVLFARGSIGGEALCLTYSCFLLYACMYLF